MDRFPQGLRLNDSWNDSRRFFDHLHAMTLSFTIGLFMPQLLPLNGVLWDFDVQYDFSSQGQIDLVVDFRKTKGSDLERTDDTALADVCILCCTFLYEVRSFSWKSMLHSSIRSFVHSFIRSSVHLSIISIELYVSGSAFYCLGYFRAVRPKVHAERKRRNGKGLHA